MKNDEIRAFRIEVAPEVLSDLRQRLKNTRWSYQLEGTNWDAGTDLDYLKELVDYWQNTYDWQKQETALNQFAHFKTGVDGIGIHFIHERGKGPNPFPIILTHGYPDSSYRFAKIIPMLTDPESFGGRAEDAFDVVVPDLPGYGFSDKPTKNGTIFRVNDLWTHLMTNKLGYERFGAHGGDWGSTVTEHLARSHPDSVVAIHLTDVPFGHIFQKLDDASLAEKKFFKNNEQWLQKEGAYALIQSTKPQSLAHGLNDSPAGLAAWIVEKFRGWSDCGGKIESRFTKDELLTHVMIYWATVHSVRIGPPQPKNHLPSISSANPATIRIDNFKFQSGRRSKREIIPLLPQFARLAFEAFLTMLRSDKISRMELKVLFSEDPAFVLSRADTFLSSEPVLHNLILSILHSRIAQGDAGRYWIALHGAEAVGVVVQSPLEYPATLTPMEPRAVLAIVDAIAEAGVTLAGVNGDAATAASFAGQWSERRKSAVTPFQGTRLYELLELGEVPRSTGHLRQAGPRDRSLMILWTRAFQDEIEEPANDTERRVDRALAAGQIWLWDQNGETTSMAVGREPAQGVVRLSGVYTPPEKRKHGYAAACVHALSKHLRDSGYRCILYTDLGNPTSNSIYRRIGYKAVAEALRYRFE